MHPRHISGPQKPSTRSNALRSLRHCKVLENLIQALSRTFRHKFKDFQEPCLFSRTFQDLKIWKKNSRTFKDPQEPWTQETCASFWYRIFARVTPCITHIMPQSTQAISVEVFNNSWETSSHSINRFG